jgi:hypothetical protein
MVAIGGYWAKVLIMAGGFRMWILFLRDFGSAAL